MSEDKIQGMPSATNGGKHSQNGKTSDARKRVTFVLPESLDRLLEAYCGLTGKQKTDVGIKALADYLSRHRNDFEASFETATNFLNPAEPNPAVHSSRSARRRHA